jgi:hypothetical protein
MTAGAGRFLPRATRSGLDIDLGARGIGLIGLAKERGEKGERVFRPGDAVATLPDPWGGQPGCRNASATRPASR